MKFDFRGKTVLISGGTHGIGLSCVNQFLKLGSKVITFSRDKRKIDLSKKKFKKFNKNFYVEKGDILDENFLYNFSKKLIKKFKKIDILIHNVGGGGKWGSEDLTSVNAKLWDEVYKKNINGIIFFNKFFLNLMKKKNWGRVITISSVSATEFHEKDRAWFNAAKSSQLSIMKNLSKNKKYTNFNITFNTVSPGPVFIKNTYWHKIKKKNPKHFKNWINKNIPVNRFGNVEDVSNLVVFLASHNASFINGANFIIDGGKSNSL